VLPRQEGDALRAVDRNLVVVLRVELDPVLILKNAGVDNHADDWTLRRFIQPVPQRDRLHFFQGILCTKCHDVLAVR